MEASILQSIKKVLNISPDYKAFDPDIIIHINSTMSFLDQLGIIPEDFILEDESATWEELNLPTNQLGMVKTYIYLRVRYLFDPPTTSFLLDAVKKQIEEHEWRLSVMREGIEHPYSEDSVDEEVIV